MIPTWKIALATAGLVTIFTLTMAVHYRDLYLPCIKLGGVIPIAGDCR